MSAHVPAPRVGRPPIGTPIQVRLPEDLLDRLDRLARSNGVSRAEQVRVLLEQGLRLEHGLRAARR